MMSLGLRNKCGRLMLRSRMILIIYISQPKTTREFFVLVWLLANHRLDRSPLNRNLFRAVSALIHVFLSMMMDRLICTLADCGVGNSKNGKQVISILMVWSPLPHNRP